MCRPAKRILIYGLDDASLAKLAFSAQPKGIEVIAVTDTETARTVGELLSDADYPPAEPCPIAGKFALMDGFKGQEKEGTDLINEAASGVVKAVHTDHNDKWRFCDLCSEILEEHEYMRKMYGKK